MQRCGTTAPRTSEGTGEFSGGISENAGSADNEWKTVYLRVKVAKGAVCTFAYSLDGKKYTAAGEPFTARQGKWIGAKVGLFCVTPNDGNRGWADVDWFRVTK